MQRDTYVGTTTCWAAGGSTPTPALTGNTCLSVCESPSHDDAPRLKGRVTFTHPHETK